MSLPLHHLLESEAKLQEGHFRWEGLDLCAAREGVRGEEGLADTNGENYLEEVVPGGSGGGRWRRMPSVSKPSQDSTNNKITDTSSFLSWASLFSSL